MSVNVPLDRLRAELEDRRNAVYLLTVGDDGRPHSVAVTVHWETEMLVMRSGTTSTRNAAARRLVTLLSPPTSAPGAGGDGYSLIVDGQVSHTTITEAGRGKLSVRPTHAVLHRPACAPGGGPAHDCGHVFDEA